MTNKHLSAAKYVELVNQIGQELGYAPGWRGQAANRLGISMSLLSQICNGRKVTSATLQKAIETRKLPPNYFDVQVAPPTIPPPAPNGEDSTHIPAPPVPGPASLPVDPLLVLDAFARLPIDTQRRLMALMQKEMKSN